MRIYSLRSLRAFYFCFSSLQCSSIDRLGLTAEGGSSVTFIQRMGVAKAKEALYLGKRLSAQELKACGFVK